MALLFDHLVGAGEQRRRNLDPNRLRRLVTIKDEHGHQVDSVPIADMPDE
jgi:hypothetical protein